MANPRRAATIRPSRAAMAADVGPNIEHYNIPLDSPAALYRWVVGNVDTADALNILTHSGGTTGRWHRQREAIKGANLGDASVDVGIGGNRYRVLPAATLTMARTLTLVTTAAVAGDIITITRRDVTANTVALVNGGPGAGTLITLPASQRYFADVYYDGTNWELLRAGQMT